MYLKSVAWTDILRFAMLLFQTLPFPVDSDFITYQNPEKNWVTGHSSALGSGIPLLGHGFFQFWEPIVVQSLVWVTIIQKTFIRGLSLITEPKGAGEANQATRPFT